MRNLIYGLSLSDILDPNPIQNHNLQKEVDRMSRKLALVQVGDTKAAPSSTELAPGIGTAHIKMKTEME